MPFAGWFHAKGCFVRPSHCMQPSSFILVFHHRVFVTPCLIGNPVTLLPLWVLRTFRALWGRIHFSVGVSDTLLVGVFAPGCQPSGPEGAFYGTTSEKSITLRCLVVKGVSRFMDQHILGRRGLPPTVEATLASDGHFTDWLKLIVYVTVVVTRSVPLPFPHSPCLFKFVPN